MNPTRAQIRTSEAVVQWYFQTHFGSAHDPGLPRMFFDQERVGRFAVEPASFARGDSTALHRMLVAMIMFQRRQDVQISRVLRGIGAAVAGELTSPRRLLRMVDESTCSHLKTSEQLHGRCDLTKDGRGAGTCTANPTIACHLKRHTVVLKRYGHFGKFPTSVALMLRELRLRGLRDLYLRTLRDFEMPSVRADALLAAVSRVWRVSDKIGAMFLSAVTNPDIGNAPWSEGIDWTRFVVVDSNVDLFLTSIGYRGNTTYNARREFVTAIARRIDLQAFSMAVNSFNPRLVQQAMYLFMSASNRRALANDCMAADACGDCSRVLTQRCPVAHAPVA